MNDGWSRWKGGIIPARNYLFASIAGEIVSRSSKQNPKIFICAHKEEITPVNTDKSHRFYDTCSSIFSTAYNKNITVTTPFFNLTKPEIVSYWRRNWTDKYSLSPQETVSCYFGNNCGSCKACINRAVAFTCAGENLENFKNNPFADKEEIILNDYVDRFDNLEEKRRIDFIYSLNKYYKQLPSELKKFVNNKNSEFEDKLEPRLNEINNSKIEE